MQIVYDYRFLFVKFYFKFVIAVFLHNLANRDLSSFGLYFLYPSRIGGFYLINKVIYFRLPRIVGFVQLLAFRFCLKKKTAHFYFAVPKGDFSAEEVQIDL